MGIVDILLIAVALAMDCFAISIVSGVIKGKWSWRNFLQMSFMFGLFQALMPLLGWFCTNKFYDYINTVDHWIAFAILLFLGIKMIKDSREPDDEEHHHFNPASLKTQIMLAVATSIDALAVGISFACVGYNDLINLCFPLFVIGLVSLFMGLLGSFLGIRFGKKISKQIQPELIGGIILIIIGFKVLLTA